MRIRSRQVLSGVAVAVLLALAACSTSAGPGGDPAHRAQTTAAHASTPSTVSSPAPPITSASTPPTTRPPSKKPTATPTIGPPPTTTTSPETRPGTTPPDGPQLPGGGRTLFPGTRIVAYYGAAHTAGLGVLGQGTPDDAWARLSSQAAEYDGGGAVVLPAYELIATIADATPGPDGMYRSRSDDSLIQPYLDSARRHHVLLILDIQPGRSDFLTEAKVYQKWLAQPDVALALDPEWRMGSDEVPGEKIGGVDASEINATASWLEGLVVADNLPQKLLLIHQFTNGMIRDKSSLSIPPRLAAVVNMDGFGGQAAKLSKYHLFAADTRYPMGLKLFYRQDIDLMSPSQVIGLSPSPAVIEYE